MKKDEMITSENEVVKEYQIPELINLNGIDEVSSGGGNCYSGTSASACGSGGGGNL